MRFLFLDILRTIKLSIGRFLAIAGICALGAGFFAGLQMTPGIMKFTETNYLNNTNMMDFKVVCSLGFSDDNIDDFRSLEDIDGVMPSRETDLLVNHKESQFVVRLHSLPKDACASESTGQSKIINDDKDYMNRPILIKGEWPKNLNECLICPDMYTVSDSPKIGDELDIIDCSTGIETTLKTRKLKITGFIHSSYYLNSIQLGTTNLGTTKVATYAYTLDSTFSESCPYTEVFLSTIYGKNFISNSKEYQDYIDKVKEKIEPDVNNIINNRLNGIKNDGQNKIDAQQNELDKKENDINNEFASKEQQLDNALRILNDTSNSLVSAKQQLDNAYAQFYDSKKTILEELEQAKQKLNYTNNLACGLFEKHKKNSVLANSANLNICSSWSSADSGLELMLQVIKDELGINANTYIFLDTYIEDPTMIEKAKLVLGNQKSNLDSMYALCSDFYSTMQSSSDKQAVYNEYINTYKLVYPSFYAFGFTVPNAFYNGIIENVNILISQFEVKENEINAQLSLQEYKLRESSQLLNKKKLQFITGKTEYDKGVNEFNEAKINADLNITDYEKQIQESQDKLNNLSSSDNYILDRTKNIGTVLFNEDSDRIANIANLFPLIFLFVALLVTLTSMTRMVEEERLVIGTYKALGFSKFVISCKYVIYGVVACLIGSIIGTLLLCQLLPFAILFAHGMIYNINIILPFQYNLPIMLSSILLVSLLTCIAVITATIKSLQEQPSQLMLPKSPKAGSRIILEKIKPFWSKLSFNWKITLRNTFLYKKRLFMTVIGIAGCTALLICGFVFYYSVNTIVPLQYNDINHSNIKIKINNNTHDDAYSYVKDTLLSFDASATWNIYDEEILSTHIENGRDLSIYATCVKDPSNFHDDFTMRTPDSKNEIHLEDGGIYISQKLAEFLNVKVGDTITLNNQDAIGNAGDKEYRIKVFDIFENYIYHLSYMTEKTFVDTFDKNLEYNNINAKVNIDEENKQTLINDLTSSDLVLTASFTDSVIDNAKRMLSVMNIVVIIILLSAAALAFIVLFNLININITERIREIATLKVLGFNSKEVNMYIHRETYLLSTIGMCIGILFGYILSIFVVKSAEISEVMFNRNVPWWAFLAAIILTLIFTTFVVVVMKKKLRSISMVESLKSID